MEDTNSKQGKSKGKLLTIGSIVFVLLLMGCLAVVSFGYYKEKNRKLTSQEIQEMQEKEVEILLAEVRRHMLLPEDQDPSVATIIDAESLRSDSPFFEKAENGFKVIIYPDRAILFDPTNSIIINVAPVQLQQDTSQDGEPQPTTTEESESESESESEVEGAEDVVEEEDEGSTSEE